MVALHSGAPIVTDSASSSFALVGDPAALRGFDAFSVGSGDYPDGSTTIVMQLETLAEGRPLRLTGPGIKESATIAPSPLPEGFLNWLAANHASFPCGIDVILVAGANFAALPRTTTVKPMEA